MRNISTFMEQFINLMLNAFKWVFDTLDSIKIGPVSLLEYSITLVILGTILPILFTIPKLEKRETKGTKGTKRGANKDETK